MNEDDIRKTYLQRLDEAQKARNSSLAVYSALVFSAVIIRFSAHVTNSDITIPLLDLKMDPDNGIEIILLVSLVLLFRYFSLDAHISVISAKVKSLSKELTDQLITLPSTLSSFTLIRKTDAQIWHSAISMALLLAIPLGLAAYSGGYQLLSKKYLPTSFVITFVADLVIAGLSVLISTRAKAPVEPLATSKKSTSKKSRS